MRGDDSASQSEDERNVGIENGAAAQETSMTRSGQYIEAKGGLFRQNMFPD